jgi:hypothetical protein
MLTLLEARSNQGALLSLPLQDVSDGYVLAEVEGLDPVKATIVSSSFAQQDGSQYQSAYREARNIKLKLDLEPDWASMTVSDLRNRLYAFFMPKSSVKLTFYTSSGLNVDISGRVETFETPLFSKEPSIDISMICFDPDFVDPDLITVSGSTVSTTTRQLVHYDGSVDSGVVFALSVNRALSAFSIYHDPPDGSHRQLDFAASLVSGDVLSMSTVPGNKYATLLRSGVSSSLLYGVSPQSVGPTLQPGDNYIRVYATGAAIPWTIKYTNRYGGL